jgi:aldose sugar dehydrogenase
MRFMCLLLVLCELFSLKGFSQPGELIRSEEQSFRKEYLVEGLKDAWAMTRLPDGRILVTEKQGKLRLIQDNKLLPDPVANIPEVDARGQGGLLDIELHPDYLQNGWIYLAYSRKIDSGSCTNIIRGRLKDNALVDIETVFEPPTEDYTNGGNHYGCKMEFDREKFLYFGIGDRGDSTTPANRAQKLTHVAGKIHRIRDDGKIPEDNPFYQTQDARPSIWSYGNRNPQGLRFHPGTGQLWETEHGPRGGDELNVIKKGVNYGWPIITYGINYSGTPITDITEKEGMEQPIIHWTPSIAVSAIDFYMGNSFPKWKNNIFVGCLAQQKLIRVVLDDSNKVTHQEIILQGGGRIRDVHCWEDGLIYVLYAEGKIVRLSLDVSPLPGQSGI